MITGIVGLPGDGKTLLGVKFLLDDMAEGRKVYANFSSRKQRWDRVSWSKVMQLMNATVLIDEAHMWFPARSSLRETTKHELAIFQQHRKGGLNFIWTAQHEDRIDVALRELTAFVYQCRRFGPFVLWSKFQGLKSTQMLQRGIIRINKYQHEYWTEERVLGRDEVATETVVGCRPNWARYDDGFGRVWWRERNNGGPFLGRPESLWYESPYGGPWVRWDEDGYSPMISPEEEPDPAARRGAALRASGRSPRTGNTGAMIR